jgi:DDE family transposase
MRLVLLVDVNGAPVGYTLVAANEKEYEPVRELTTSQAGCLLIADKGLWGREYVETLALQQVTIRTPDRVRTAANLADQKRLASIRLAIESMIANLKGQMRLEQHLAKTPAGLAQRIAQRLLALTLGMLLNALTGRPPRALAAYDGR